MKVETLYGLNYYDANSKLREDAILLPLREDSVLTELLSHSLMDIKESLYSISHGADKSTLLDAQLQHEGELNRIVKEDFQKDIIERIDNEQIVNSLVTDAFKRLISNILQDDRLNHEKYQIQTFVLHFLEERLAKIISEDDRFSDLPTLFNLLKQASLLHRFYNSLADYIPARWIEKDREEWTSIVKKPIDILNSISTFDRDYFTNYEQTLAQAQTQSLVRFVKEASRYSDYAGFGTSLAFKSHVLFKAKIDFWILFWDKLELPVLQDIEFHYFKSPIDILDMAEALVRNKDLITNPRTLAVLILQNSLECAVNTVENLSFYLQEDRTKHLTGYESNDELLELGRVAFAKWKAQNLSYFEKLFNLLSTILSIDEIEEWVFSNSRRTGAKSAYTDNFNQQILTVYSAFENLSQSIPFDQKLSKIRNEFTLEKFNFLVRQVREGSELSQEQSVELLNLLVSFTLNDQFYWDETYSEIFWDAMKGIGYLLCLGGSAKEQAFEIINRAKCIHEGWKVDKDYKKIRTEAFLLCGIAMSIENDSCFDDREKRHTFFYTLLDHVVQQYRFAGHYNAEHYILPLHILSLIANQIDPSLKIRYEATLITQLDDLLPVLQILSSDNYILDEASKELLAKKVRKEATFLKKDLLRKQSEIKPAKVDAWIAGLLA